MLRCDAADTARFCGFHTKTPWLCVQDWVYVTWLPLLPPILAPSHVTALIKARKQNKENHNLAQSNQEVSQETRKLGWSNLV